MPRNEENQGGTPSIKGWLLRELVLVESVRSGKLPTSTDLDRLAKRIWEEVQGEEAVAWGSLSRSSGAYLQTMRIARAALGCSSPAVE